MKKLFLNVLAGSLIIVIFLPIVDAKPFSEITCGETSSIVDTVGRLRNIKVNPEDPTIPVAAKPLLKQLKHQLRDLIITTLNDKHSYWRNPKEVQEIIIEKLKQGGIKIEEPKAEILDVGSVISDYSYGDIYRITIEKPFARPDLIAATTTLGVCCGEDASLYIFQKTTNKWKMIFTYEINDYDTIEAAHGTFNYGILGKNNKKDLFVVTAYINPWPISNWQEIYYSVFQISRSTESEPKSIFNESQTIYIGVNPPIYKLVVGSNKFSLRFYGGEKLNPDGTAPLQLLEYIIKDNKIERVYRKNVK